MHACMPAHAAAHAKYTGPMHEHSEYSVDVIYGGAEECGFLPAYSKASEPRPQGSGHE